MAAKPSPQSNPMDQSKGEDTDDRPEIPPGRSLPPVLPPPEDGRCLLLDRCHADVFEVSVPHGGSRKALHHSNLTVFEMVLDRVSTRDLVALMVTSRGAKAVVDQYVEHRLRKDQR